LPTLTCRCGVDVHAHVVPRDFPAYAGRSVPGAWPGATDAAAVGGLCHRNIVIGGKNYRTVSEKCWSPSRRIADFAEMGLARQAISPMPELLSYWFEPADALQLLRYLNGQIADMVAEAGGALVGLGAVPLQDMDMAIGELRRLMEQDGFAGVEIGSNVNGVPIGDARFLPFFEACQALDAAVFVHALRPTGMDRLVGPAPLQQVLAYPSDVGLAAASVITSNLLLRLPGLRIAFSHGGGTLASLLPRVQQGWGAFPALAESMEQAPREQARRLFFDSLVFDSATLQHLVATFGADRLMLGTDHPFNFHESRPVERVAACGFDGAVEEALLWRNAERFLGRSQKETRP
jgi:aminocarboxymuconate-semialdehyde decarboxylase